MTLLVEGVPVFVELAVLAFAPCVVVWVVLAMLTALHAARLTHAAAHAGLAVLAARGPLMLVMAATEDAADGLTDGRADATRLARLVRLTPLAAGVHAMLARMLTGLAARLAVSATVTALTAAERLVAHLSAHARRSAADMCHAATVAAAHRAALMLAGVLLATLLPRLRIDAVALAAVILLAGAAAHGLAVALTIAARAVLPAIAAVAGVVGTRGLPVAALRLAVTGFTFF